ncbi:MAG: entericidin [Paludibacteraceae bacterium]|nr:entericidin [Paludibacteraceae bacterium]
MKKVVLFAAVAAMVSFASCGGNNEVKADSDSVAVDTVAVDTVVVDSVVADSVAADSAK